MKSGSKSRSICRRQRLAGEGKTMNAHNLAYVRGKTNKFNFGMDPVKTAAALRLIADQIDEKSLLPQSCVTYERANHDDFAMSTVVFKFAGALLDWSAELKPEEQG